MAKGPSKRKLYGLEQDELGEKIKQYARVGSFDKISESVAAFVAEKMEQGQLKKPAR